MVARQTTQLVSISLDSMTGGESIPNEPIRISLSVDSGCHTAEAIGQRLSRLLETIVHTDTVKYLSGDEFAFCVERSFESPK
jgi:hypothetical protein